MVRDPAWRPADARVRRKPLGELATSLDPPGLRRVPAHGAALRKEARGLHVGATCASRRSSSASNLCRWSGLHRVASELRQLVEEQDPVMGERLGMYLDIQFATRAPGASLIMFGARVGAISTSLAAGAMRATVVRLIGAGQT
jgi:hypothetical protein